MGEQRDSLSPLSRTKESIIHPFYQGAAGLPGGSASKEHPFYTHPDTRDLVDHFEDLVQARQVREKGKPRKISDDRRRGLDTVRQLPAGSPLRGGA